MSISCLQSQSMFPATVKTDKLDTKTKNTVKLLSIIKTTKVQDSHAKPGPLLVEYSLNSQGIMKQWIQMFFNKGRHLSSWILLHAKR